jgi:predicted metal-dependent phosphoesterase TrpH
MMQVEFHCHTEYSPDSRLKVADLIASARKKGLDRVVVTDHNEIIGAKLAREIAPDLIIIGEEILTSQGELLAAYVQEKVPKGLTPEAAIKELRSQGAFISVSHPFDSRRNGAWREDDLRRIAPLVDAIEVYNSRCMVKTANQQAGNFARQYSLAGTVGSDAHAGFELGRSRLILPDFFTAAELKKVFPQTDQITVASPFWVHFVSRWAKWSKTLLRA